MPPTKRRQSNPRLLTSIDQCCFDDLMDWAATTAESGDEVATISQELLRLNWAISDVMEALRHRISQRRTQQVPVLKDRHNMSWREIAEASGMSMTRCRQVYTGAIPPDGSDSWITQTVDDR